ncbi:MAG: hypothetical protein K5675_07685 [Lachnospiraceae bacterium]|nr:hypothetical protein [Lachnospiraceae bacterium]
MNTPEEDGYVSVIFSCPECKFEFEGYAWDYENNPQGRPFCPECNNLMRIIKK